MKVQLCSLIVVRDPLMKVPRTIPAWELPILEAMYGQGNLEDVSFFVGEVDHVLPPDEEFDRLCKSKVYGSDKEVNLPFAQVVYGRGSVGVQKLAQAMQAALATDEEEAPKRRGRPPKSEQAAEQDE